MGWLDELMGLFGSSGDFEGMDVSGYGDVGYEAPDFSGYGDVGYSAPLMEDPGYDWGGFDPYASSDAAARDLEAQENMGAAYGSPGGGVTQSPLGTPNPYATAPSGLSQLLSGAGRFLGGALGGAKSGGAGGLTALLNQGTEIPGGVEGVDTYSPTPLAQPTPAGLSQFEPAVAQGGGGLERLLAMMGSR